MPITVLQWMPKSAQSKGGRKRTGDPGCQDGDHAGAFIADVSIGGT